MGQDWDVGHGQPIQTPRVQYPPPPGSQPYRPPQYGQQPPPYQPPYAPPPGRAPRRRKPRKGLRLLAWGSVALLALVILVIILGGKNNGSTPSAGTTATGAASTGTTAKASGCNLKTTFDYIVRDDDPGASVMAQEIGNVDFASCTDSLTDFAATAGQSAGECTTIALASKNPGYDVNAVPAPPLKDVIQSAGPGCR